MADPSTHSLASKFDNDTSSRRRRLVWLLTFLVVFFAAVAAYLLINRNTVGTVFYAKGILTGAGTFLALLAAALIALILLLAMWVRSTKRWEASDPHEARTLAAWLAVDVFGGAESPSGEWSELSGTYRGRSFRFDRPVRDAIGPLRATVSVNSPLAFTVRRSADAARTTPSEYATGDADFEAQCDWQSAAPAETAVFFKAPGVTDALLRLKEVLAADERLALENGKLTIDISHVDWFKSSLILHDFSFLADVLEGKPVTFTARIRPQAKPPRFLGCLTLLVVAALVWTAGSYLCARVVGMWGGMVCFFAPMLLMAFFVFTRPATAKPENTAMGSAWLPNDEEFKGLWHTYEERLKHGR